MNNGDKIQETTQERERDSVVTTVLVPDIKGKKEYIGQRGLLQLTTHRGCAAEKELKKLHLQDVIA